RVNVPERTGIKAIASAPPEMRAKSKSGRLLAALKASNWLVSPKISRLSFARTSANILSKKNRKPMSSDVRARKDNLFMDKINDRRVGDFLRAYSLEV